MFIQPPIPDPRGEPEKKQDAEPESEISIPVLSKEVKERIRETNYGRAAGWIVEYGAEPVALFTDCQYEDMFWESYHVTPLTQNESLLAKMRNEEFFFDPEVVFRNRELPDVPLVWRPLIHLSEGADEVIARGLYLVIDPSPPQKRPPAVSTWLDCIFQANGLFFILAWLFILGLITLWESWR